MTNLILTRVRDQCFTPQQPQYWAIRFGQLTLQAIRAGYPVNEVYHCATLAASHASDVLVKKEQS